MSNKAYIATNINRGFVFKDDYTEFISGNTGINQFLDGYLFSQIRTLNPEIKEVFYRNIEGLKAIISDEYEKQEALNMALEVMDISLSEEYRIGIAGLLDTEISNHPEYLGFIKNRLHSTALPDLFNTVFIDAKKSIFSKEFISLYDDIKEKARLFNCFHTLLKLSLNLEIAELELIDSRLTDNGAYAAFTNAISQYSQKKYYQAVIIAIPVLEELHFFTNKQLFIEIETKLFENYQIKLEEHSFLDVSGNQFKVSDSPDPIIQLIERYIDEKQVKHDEKRSKRGMARRVKDYEREMNSIVTEMKEWLVKNSYNGPIFFKQFESVAEKQLRSGHPEHLCKTCCDLATIFIEKSQFAISETLLTYAELLNPEDKYVHTQKAVLFHKQNKLEKALEQYDEVIKKFGEDSVGYNGRAEVLRDLGRPEEALKQYDEAIIKFSEDSVGYNGRAEVLRDLGRPEEALKQYDEVIKKFRENSVGYNGRAEVLRDLGRPEEALKQYDEVIKLFPFDDVSKKGRIQVLLEEDKYDEFNKAIKKVNYITFGDYVQLHMYCMYLIKVGDWEQAREKIAIGLASPFNQHRKYFKNINAYLDILKNQFSNALKELDSIRIHTPAQSLLIIHANAENNTKQKAIKELHKLESIKRPVIYITLGYLSERYSLNGFKKTNKTKEDLDKLIQEGEMKALLQY